MSSPPFDDTLHFLDQNFPTPLEISDSLWPFLQEGRMFLPIDYHNTNGMVFKELENENSALAITSIHKEVLSEVSTLNYHHEADNSSSSPLECTFVQESSTSLLQANNHNKASGELDSCIFLREEFQELAMNSINEGLYYKKDNPFPVFEERITTCELDPKLILHDHEQENSLMEKTIKESTSTKENLTGGDEMDSSTILDQENAVIDNSSVEKELLQDNKIETKEIKHTFRILLSEKMEVQPNGEEGSSTSKKRQHNAKEKVRRMKLNACYLALGSLLPNSKRSKKRWSAPIIVDRVLEYIPELENEIEELTLKKNSLESNKSENDYNQPIQQNSSIEFQALKVSVHEVRQGEVIIQICMQINQDNLFSNILQNLESQGMIISSASSIHICDGKACYHIHLKMNGSPLGGDYVAALKEKVISWLK